MLRFMAELIYTMKWQQSARLSYRPLFQIKTSSFWPQSKILLRNGTYTQLYMYDPDTDDNL